LFSFWISVNFSFNLPLLCKASVSLLWEACNWLFNCLIFWSKIASFLVGFCSWNGWIVFSWSEFLLGLSSKKFSGVLGEILLVNIPGVFLSVFGVNKELYSPVRFWFGISGFCSIKIGLGVLWYFRKIFCAGKFFSF